MKLFMTIPNQLTLLRILLIPVFIVVFYLPYESSNFFACGIFILAAVTDILDGYYARKLNQISQLGVFLDPVADKLMVAVVLVLLVQRNPEIYLAIPAAIIIGREITVSALREWMAELGKRANIAVSYVGKVKTAAQMGSITVLMGGEHFPWVIDLGFIALYLAAVLTIWSMLVYLKAAWPELRA